MKNVFMFSSPLEESTKLIVRIKKPAVFENGLSTYKNFTLGMWVFIAHGLVLSL